MNNILNHIEKQKDNNRYQYKIVMDMYFHPFLLYADINIFKIYKEVFYFYLL